MAYGTRVRSITLFLFGGVSNIEREPRSPAAEFFTAVVGPITSIALGFLFIILASALTPLASVTGPEEGRSALMSLGPVSTLLVWLGPINILIGLFNLIPAFPLDGGRIFRAALWGLSGNLRQATQWAARIGQATGWLFIIAGIGMSFGARVPFFGTGLIGGLWLAFIGWFLNGAAAQATARLALDDALAGLTVDQLMNVNVTTVPPELTVTALVQDHLVRGADRALAVTRDDALLGLVCVSDVRKVPPEEWSTTPVFRIMRGVDDLAIATPDQSLAEAFENLVRSDIDQLPVVSNGRLVGMLRRLDIARWLELAWRPGAAPGQPTAAPRAGRPTREPRFPSIPHGREPHPGPV
jgi:Zn-dependent protease/predicted transcriptional regulator